MNPKAALAELNRARSALRRRPADEEAQAAVAAAQAAYDEAVEAVRAAERAEQSERIRAAHDHRVEAAWDRAVHEDHARELTKRNRARQQESAA